MTFEGSGWWAGPLRDSVAGLPAWRSRSHRWPPLGHARRSWPSSGLSRRLRLQGSPTGGPQAPGAVARARPRVRRSARADGAVNWAQGSCLKMNGLKLGSRRRRTTGVLRSDRLGLCYAEGDLESWKQGGCPCRRNQRVCPLPQARIAPSLGEVA